jgi:hypothetical protein
MRRPLVVGLLLLVAHSVGASELPDDWAFKPVRRPAVPAVASPVRNPVDAFLLERLTAAKLDFAPPADRSSLLRRVTMDLTGLPPTVADLEAFLADRSPNAFEKVVDRLLASPA